MSISIIIGDCREQLQLMESQSVNCCVTSPPYFGLRDYGVDGQIGLEPTPDAFVAEMVNVFREVRRVLRDDGTLWLNLGDTYANDGKCGGETGGKQHYLGEANRTRVGRERRHTGLKPKDLIGIPWMVAFALRTDGWWLRQEIIWAKPNPMPESVRDRCTKAHEQVFLLTKSARYYFDADAIKERASENTNARLPGNKRHSAAEEYEGGDEKHRTKGGLVSYAERKRAATGSGVKNNDSFDAAMAVMPSHRNKRSVWTVGSEPFSEAHFATFPPALIEPMILAGCPKSGTVLDPFGGAGTTGLVADRLGRNAVLIELNPSYAEMTRRRISGDAPLLANVT
jgi:DNA modification methylase